MQERPVEMECGPVTPVGGVAHQRMPDCCQVNPDLMCSAGFESAFHQGHLRHRPLAPHLVAGSGLFAGSHDGHAGTVTR